MSDADASVSGSSARHPLAEPAPDAVVGNDVPATLGALLDRHGMDPAFDSRRYTGSGRSKIVEDRHARAIRACHGAIAVVITAGIALVLGADAVQTAIAVAVGAIAMLAIARSHLASPGRRPLREILVGFTAAAVVAAVVALLPPVSDIIPGFFLVPTADLAAVVAAGAATVGVAASFARRAPVARASTLVAAALIALAI